MSNDTTNKVNWPTVIIVLGIGFLFWWANQPPDELEPTYTMPPIKAGMEVKGFNYKTNTWDYYEIQEQKVYTKAELQQLKWEAQQMKEQEFEEEMEDYLEDQESWGQ